MHQEAGGACSLSAERRIENHPPREAGAWQNSCEKGMKSFSRTGEGEHRELEPCFVSDFAGNKDASRSVGKFMLPVERKNPRKPTNSENIKSTY